jgi:hypothetical protein
VPEDVAKKPKKIPVNKAPERLPGISFFRILSVEGQQSSNARSERKAKDNSEFDIEFDARDLGNDSNEFRKT